MTEPLLGKAQYMCHQAPYKPATAAGWLHCHIHQKARETQHRVLGSKDYRHALEQTHSLSFPL